MLAVNTGYHIHELAHEKFLDKRCATRGSVRTSILILQKVLMDLVKEPIDKFVRVMMFIIVKQCIRCFERQYEALMVVGSPRFLVVVQVLEEKMQLVEHVFFAGIIWPTTAFSLLGVLLLSILVWVATLGLPVKDGLAQREAVVKDLHGGIGIADRR